jgi:hypothetical protein
MKPPATTPGMQRKMLVTVANLCDRLILEYFFSGLTSAFRRRLFVKVERTSLKNALRTAFNARRSSADWLQVR